MRGVTRALFCLLEIEVCRWVALWAAWALFLHLFELGELVSAGSWYVCMCVRVYVRIVIGREQKQRNAAWRWCWLSRGFEKSSGRRKKGREGGRREGGEIQSWTPRMEI